MKNPTCPQCRKSVIENIGCTYVNKANSDEIIRRFTVKCAECGCVFEISNTFRIVPGPEKVEIVGWGDPAYALRHAMSLLNFGEDEDDD